MDRNQQISAQWGANVPQQQQSVGDVRYPSQVSQPPTQSQQRTTQNQQQPAPPPQQQRQSQQQQSQPSQPPPQSQSQRSQQNGGSASVSSPPTVPKGASRGEADQSNGQRSHTSTMTSPVPSPFVGGQQNESQLNRVDEDVAVTVTQQNSPEDGQVNCDNQVPNVEHRVCFPGQNPHAQPPQVNVLTLICLFFYVKEGVLNLIVKCYNNF